MASLENDSGTLRVLLQLADRESLPGLSEKDARVFATASVDYKDRRDGEFWPFVRLPVLKLAGADPSDLIAALKDLCAKVVDSVAFRTGETSELALQLQRQEGGGFVIEAGIDLSAYLQQVSGVHGEEGRELALFRFTTGVSQVVRFANEVSEELAQLPPARTSAPLSSK